MVGCEKKRPHPQGHVARLRFSAQFPCSTSNRKVRGSGGPSWERALRGVGAQLRACLHPRPRATARRRGPARRPRAGPKAGGNQVRPRARPTSRQSSRAPAAVSRIRHRQVGAPPRLLARWREEGPPSRSAIIILPSTPSLTSLSEPAQLRSFTHPLLFGHNTHAVHLLSHLHMHKAHYNPTATTSTLRHTTDHFSHPSNLRRKGNRFSLSFSFPLAFL